MRCFHSILHVFQLKIKIKLKKTIDRINYKFKDEPCELWKNIPV